MDLDEKENAPREGAGDVIEAARAMGAFCGLTDGAAGWIAAAGRGAARGSEKAGRVTAWIGRAGAGGAGAVADAGSEAGGSAADGAAADCSPLASAEGATFAATAFFAAAAKEKENFEAGGAAGLDPVVGEETELAAL